MVNCNKCHEPIKIGQVSYCYRDVSLHDECSPTYKSQPSDPIWEIIEKVRDAGYADSSENDYRDTTLILEEAHTAIERMMVAARLNERKELAIGLYHGHTFSDSTDYKAKFDKFIKNNEYRIAELSSLTQNTKNGGGE